MIPVSVLEPTHVDEPQVASGYAAVLSRVAEQGQPIIVRRGGEDLAAVVPLEHLELLIDLLWKMPEGTQDELLRELLLSRKAEKMAGQIAWEQARKSHTPQHWFHGSETKPF